MIHWPALEGDYVTAAFEWNFGRSVRLASVPDRIPGSLDLRVLTILQGSWVRASANCNVLKGAHQGGCPHRLNAVPYRASAIAALLWGRAGGSEINLVRSSLQRLRSEPLIYRLDVHQPERVDAAIHDAGLPSRMHDDLTVQPEGVVAFSTDLFEGLMMGHLQVVPTGLVQGPVSSSFSVWLPSICQTGIWSTAKTDQGLTVWVTGPRPWLPGWRLGMPSLSPAELLRSIERAAKEGNRLQDKFRLAAIEVPPDGRRRKPVVAINIRNVSKRRSSGSEWLDRGSKTEQSTVGSLYRHQEALDGLGDESDEVGWDDREWHDRHADGA